MITIENLSPSKISLEKNLENKYTIDYGEISKDSNREVKLNFKSEKPLRSITTQGSCGCVKTGFTQIDKTEYDININYTRNDNPINKTAYINYTTEDKQRKRITIKIKGATK